MVIKRMYQTLINLLTKASLSLSKMILKMMPTLSQQERPNVFINFDLVKFLFLIGHFLRCLLLNHLAINSRSS